MRVPSPLFHWKASGAENNPPVVKQSCGFHPLPPPMMQVCYCTLSHRIASVWSTVLLPRLALIRLNARSATWLSHRQLQTIPTAMRRRRRPWRDQQLKDQRRTRLDRLTGPTRTKRHHSKFKRVLAVSERPYLTCCIALHRR